MRFIGARVSSPASRTRQEHGAHAPRRVRTPALHCARLTIRVRESTITLLAFRAMRRTAILSLLLATACATAPAPQIATPVTHGPLLGEHGFDLSQMDRSVNACENFYEFAVGGWRKANPLPPAFGRFGR